MKKLFKSQLLLFAVLCLSTQLKAQNAERTIVGSAGKSFTSSSLTVDFSVGEMVVFTAHWGNLTLTQGFIQPEISLLSNTQTITNHYEMQCFPNPATDHVTLVLPQGKSGKYLIELFDMNGKKYFTRNEQVNDNNSNIQLDLSEVSAGVYFIKVSNETEKTGMLKIVKTK